MEHLRQLPREADTVLTIENPEALTYRFIYVRDKLGLTMRFHDLRHFHASVLLSMDIPDKYAMKRMGHSTTNMLKSVYQHIMKDKQKEMDDAIEKLSL